MASDRPQSGEVHFRLDLWQQVNPEQRDADIDAVIQRLAQTPAKTLARADVARIYDTLLAVRFGAALNQAGIAPRAPDKDGVGELLSRALLFTMGAISSQAIVNTAAVQELLTAVKPVLDDPSSAAGQFMQEMMTTISSSQLKQDLINSDLSNKPARTWDGGYSVSYDRPPLAPPKPLKE